MAPGDEVAIQAYTCLAVPLPILALEARPRFVDVSPTDLSMDAEDLARKVSSRTRAVIVQHTFGIPGDVLRVREIADRSGVLLIEDCAHVLNGKVGDSHLGSFGTAAIYSFEWGKPLVAGVGGGVVVNDPELKARIEGSRAGLRIPPLRQRALLEAQYWAYRTLLSGRSYWALRGLYHWLSRRGLVVGTFRQEDYESARENEEFSWSMAPRTHSRLTSRLGGVGDLVRRQRELREIITDGLTASGLPTWPIPEDRSATLMRYPLLCRDKQGLLEAARRARVEISAMFKTPIDPIPPEQSGWLCYDSGSCPVAEKASESVISLPINPRVSENDVHRTIEFLESHRELLVEESDPVRPLRDAAAARRNS